MPLSRLLVFLLLGLVYSERSSRYDKLLQELKRELEESEGEKIHKEESVVKEEPKGKVSLKAKRHPQ